MSVFMFYDALMEAVCVQEEEPKYKLSLSQCPSYLNDTQVEKYASRTTGVPESRLGDRPRVRVRVFMSALIGGGTRGDPIVTWVVWDATDTLLIYH